MSDHQDCAEATRHYVAFLKALGAPMAPDDREACARRVTALLRDWSTGAGPLDPPLSTFAAPHPADWVMVRQLRFYSLCEHHMLPFFGEVDVAYLPGLRIAGFGSIARLLDHESRRPQLQEHLGASLAEALSEALAPVGLLVRVSARQLCMEMRGHPSPAPCVTVATRGVCRHTDGLHAAMRLLG